MSEFAARGSARTRLLVLLWLATSFACRTAPPQEGVVARVGQRVLTKSEVEARLPVGLEAEVLEAERTHLIDNWVRQELLFQEALRRGLEENARVQELIAQARRDLLVATLLDAEFSGSELHIGEDSIRQYYEENQEQFQRLWPEVRARHLLAASQRDANAWLQGLQRGDDFADLARDHSLDPDTRLEGGDLGYFSEEDNPELWEICEDLPVHRISTPIRSEYGYHIIQVLDRQESGTVRELQHVRPQIIEALVRRRYAAQLEQLIENLKKTHDWSARGPSATP